MISLNNFSELIHNYFAFFPICLKNLKCWNWFISW